MSRYAARLQRLAWVLLVALALRFLLAPDALDGQRRADALLVRGEYLAALRAYRALADDDPQIALRLGVLYALRGEHRRAEDALRRSLHLGLRNSDRDLAYLYLGQQHALQARLRYATNAWAQIGPRSPYYPFRLVLEAEQALANEDYALAEAQLRQTLTTQLPDGWPAILRYRLALLLAARDPTAATVLLAQPLAAPSNATPPLLKPLLPLSAGQLARDSQRLRTALQQPTDARSQSLGQIYIDAQLYRLADAQLASVSDESQTARTAAAYAAYSRWQAGDRAAGMARLKALVERYPNDLRAHSLLAVAYLQLRQPEQAQPHLALAVRDSPNDPVTRLAWGQWYLAHGDYAQAADQYRRATEQAPAEERAQYALIAARFALESGYALCDQGRTMARQSAELAPSAEAWTMLAAAHYHCGEPRATAEAARQALALDAHAVAAQYYLGVALADLGNTAEARIALTRAADLAPASVWRERAEVQLNALRTS